MCLFPISFPEPTCLLVSAKTRSSGIINFQSPKFYEFWFHGACVPWFTWCPEIKLMWTRSTKAFNTHWKELFKSKQHKGCGNEIVDCVLALTKRHACELDIFQCRIMGQSYAHVMCCFEKNFHTPPMEGFWNWTPHPSGKSILVSYFHSKNWSPPWNFR